MRRRGRIQLVSPMWPAGASPVGVFVKNIADALAEEGFAIDARAVIAGPHGGLWWKTRAHSALGLKIAAAATEEADLLYVHAPSWFALPAQLAARARRKPIVVHMHGGEVYPFSRVEHWSRPVVMGLSRAADLVVAPSAYYAREVERDLGVDRARILISPSGGVDTELFTPRPKAEARRALGIAPGQPVLGYVGRIDPHKGWDTFLTALARLVRARRDALGLVVGEGREMSGFHAQVERERLGGHVRVLGALPQVQLSRAYAAMDVLLFPTRRAAEALGLVPIEAMSAGVPVVGSRISAVPEYVVDGENGHLSAPEQADEFAAKAERILDLCADGRARLSARAVKTAQAYDRRLVGQRLAAAMDDVLRRA